MLKRLGRIEGRREIGRENRPASVRRIEDLAIPRPAEAVRSERGLIEDEVPPSARVCEAAVDAVPFDLIGKQMDAPVARTAVIRLIAAERRQLVSVRRIVARLMRPTCSRVSSRKNSHPRWTESFMPAKTHLHADAVFVLQPADVCQTAEIRRRDAGRRG